MESIVDNRVLQNHVSPRLCQELKYAGFEVISKYFWKVYSSDIILDTYVFDIDDYYKEGNVLVDKVAPLKECLPAFTIKEIESQLPDFLICKQNGCYEIMLDKSYGINPVSDRRLPDAFALMMLAMMKKRVTNSSNKIKKV